jgi:nicotinate-nucleotide adenylyltransferase
MVEIACATDARFEASRLEDGAECSYSIDTIQKLRATLHPDDELFFIIGADAFADLRTWHRWQDVVRSVRFIVVSRPGYSYDVPAGTKVDRLNELGLVTSSSELRERLKSGDKDLDLPSCVIEYIRRQGLYGASQV